jgi:hypothetical protein
MRRWLLAALLALTPLSAHAAATAVQGTGAAFTTDASPDLAFTSNITAGSTGLICIRNGVDETTTITSITDTQGNTWTIIPTNGGPADHASTTLRGWFGFAQNMAAGATTVTVNLSAAITTSIAIAEIAGVRTTSGVDASGTTRITGSSSDTTWTSNAVVMSGAGASISCLCTNTAVTAAPATGETNVSNIAAFRAHIFFEAEASGGSKTHSATGAASHSMQFIAALAEAGAGGGATNPPAALMMKGVGR